ncbi:unnamed protein product [Bursaphelenchus okinawaensis]|uniref:Caveolin n=1 Tax=Bursaphelenchus okinawaensis TaxID=465554 RepID=A0A811KUY7_9BILA|nr:unnamed protein product [Bursaphelenchus okinawaensis]CAG9111863.1 unnamed protein product [Bursaphelenchus okinawaensis]
MAEEKVELTEQTPLKEEESKEVKESTEATIETPVEKKEAEKKRWFFNKKAKKEEKVTEEEKPKETEATDSTPAEKKGHWWQRKPCCKTDDGTQPSFGLDFVHRDEQNLHTAIDFGFNDVFGEPDALHSWNCVWKTTHNVFTGIRNAFFKLFTVIICLPSALFFGILSALFTTLSVYVVLPAARVLSIPFFWIVGLWKYLVANVVAPCFAAVGQCCGGIRIHRYGLNNDATATIA